jgi:hypothetical protein
MNKSGKTFFVQCELVQPHRLGVTGLIWIIQVSRNPRTLQEYQQEYQQEMSLSATRLHQGSGLIKACEYHVSVHTCRRRAISSDADF